MKQKYHVEVKPEERKQIYETSNMAATTKHTWFKWHLCPLLRLNSMIIMDNASWHRKFVLENIAAFYNFTIIWLFFYSPAKNRIEHRWANLKSWLRYNVKDYSSLNDAIVHYFQSD